MFLAGAKCSTSGIVSLRVGYCGYLKQVVTFLLSVPWGSSAYTTAKGVVILSISQWYTFLMKGPHEMVLV